jgi:hypothetical protein
VKISLRWKSVLGRRQTTSGVLLSLHNQEAALRGPKTRRARNIIMTHLTMKRHPNLISNATRALEGTIKDFAEQRRLLQKFLCASHHARFDPIYVNAVALESPPRESTGCMKFFHRDESKRKSKAAGSFTTSPLQFGDFARA